MGSGDRDPRLEAACRLEATYRMYAESNRKRRNWSALNRGNIAIRAELLARVVALADRQIRGVGAILDVGCGSGWMLAELVQLGVPAGRLHGVDLLEARVEAAGKAVPEADIRRADARELPYPDGRFELIALLTCLSSMADADAVQEALAEADRVLSPTGLILCYEPRIPNPLNRSTRLISSSSLRALGDEAATRNLTGLPPIARRLGALTPRIYPILAKIAPTHRLTAFRRLGA